VNIYSDLSNKQASSHQEIREKPFALDVKVDSISMEMQTSRAKCMGNIGCEKLLCFRKVVHPWLFSYDSGSS